MSDVVRGPCEAAAGSEVSCRRATVSNGGQRAEEKKVEERNRAFGGRTRFCCESSPSPPNAERAPCPSFGRGERVPFIEPFSPPPLHPPSPVARSITPLAPRGLFTRVLDVHSSCKPRPPVHEDDAAQDERHPDDEARADASQRELAVEVVDAADRAAVEADHDVSFLQGSA